MLSRRVPWRKVLGWLGLLAAAAAVVVAGVYVVFWPVSDLIARHDVGPIIGPHGVAVLQHHAAALQAARNAARGRLLTFGAGLFAAGALVYTARNFTLSRRTFELTEQGQVTERFTKAVEQLGSERLDVRLGAIYALERIMIDSPRDHPTIVDVLAAYVRGHARHDTNAAREPADRDQSQDPVHDRPTEPATDVQAALTVLGRRPSGLTERGNLGLNGTRLGAARLFDAHLAHADLRYADLRYADLRGADLRYADLHGANLRFAYLGQADLGGAFAGSADLRYADMRGANLADAHLNGENLGDAYVPGPNLTGANLSGANLSNADLSHARLADADLSHARLTGADLRYARLTGADLADANLTGANLLGALWPADAVVPAGWQRDTDSGRLKRANTSSGGAPTDAAPGA